MSHQIPYITIPDLQKVLMDAAEEDVISNLAADRIINNTLDFRQELLRKAQEQKDINELRNRCLTLSKNILRSGVRDLESKRNRIAASYIADKELLSTQHLANNAQLKEEFLASRENCLRNIDMLRKSIEIEGPDSEEGKNAAKRMTLNRDRIRDLKISYEEQKVYELNRHHKSLSDLKKKYIKDMEEVQRKIHNLNVDKNNAVLMIKQAEDSKLQDILQDLLKLQPGYRKGGRL